MQNVEDMFDTLIDGIRANDLIEKVKAKKAQIRSIQETTCGNCFKWMKTSCIPEKKYGKFKSMNDYGCSDFTWHDTGLLKRFNEELADLEAQVVKAYEKLTSRKSH